MSASLWDGVNIPPAATAVIKRIECFSATPYDDNQGLPGGTWTIGYGAIIGPDNQPVTADTEAIDQAQAEDLLLRDMRGAAAEVKRQVAVALIVHEAAALISWTYNLGGGSLARSTMLAKLNANQKSAVPAEMRKWITQGGKPLVGLLRRRWAEAAIFSGVDPGEACTQAWQDIATLDDWPAFPL